MGKYADLVGSIAEDPREKQMRESARQAVAYRGRYSKMLADLNVENKIAARAAQRQEAESAPPEVAGPAKEMLANLHARRQVLGLLRNLTPEQRAEALRIAPGIAQGMGDDRGNIATRAIGAVRQGVADFSQPIMKMTGVGGTPEEIDYIRQLQAAANQESAPARPDDPWYQRGPVQAAGMVPYAISTVAGGVAGSALGRVGGQLLARAASAGVPGARAAFQATGAVGAIPKAVGLAGATTKATMAKAGELAGITAASFPSQYVQEVDQLKEIGMEDGVGLRLLAGGTAAVTGLIEGIVPNPFKAGKAPLTEGAVKAARQYLWEAAKKAPGEMSEEYLQGVTSGLGKHVAQYLDKNAEDKSIADAFQTGWDQAKEAALPMAFLLGVPAVGGAGLSAMRAQRLTQLQEARAKGFVSADDAKTLGIEGASRKERLANVDAEIEELKQAGHHRLPPQIPPQSPPTEPGPGPQQPSPQPQPEQQPPSVSAGVLAQQIFKKLGTVGYRPPQSRADEAVFAEHAIRPFKSAAEVRQFLDGIWDQLYPNGQIPPRSPKPPTEQPQTPEQEPEQGAPEDPLDIQERALWSDPMNPLRFATTEPDAAGSLAKKPTYLEKDFEEAIGVSTPDANLRRQWKTWLREAIGLDPEVAKALQQEEFGTIGPTWTRIPDDVDPPKSDSVEVKKTSFGTVIRLKPKTAATTTQPVRKFQTSSGSTYELHPDGTTTRNRAERGDGLRTGPQPRSTKTWFVDDNELEQLARQWSNPSEVTLRETTDANGEMRLSTYNRRTGQYGNGIKFSTEPKPGLVPVEYWNDQTTIHYGNKIVDTGSPSTAGSSGESTKPTTGSKSASPDAPETETSMGETGKGQSPETRADTPRRGKVGDMLAAGEVVTTSSGRQTTPFPKVDVGSDRKAQNTVKRVDKWLHENAVEEARSRGDDYNLTIFENEDPANLPPASKDSMEEYLFGEQPKVAPPITKPLTDDSSDKRSQKPKTKSGWQPAPPSDVSIIESPGSKLETSRRQKKDPQFPITAGSPVTVYRRGSNGKEEMQQGVVEDFADHMPGNIKVRLSDGSLATPMVVDVGPPRSETAKPEKRRGRKDQPGAMTREQQLIDAGLKRIKRDFGETWTPVQPEGETEQEAATLAKRFGLIPVFFTSDRTDGLGRAGGYVGNNLVFIKRGLGDAVWGVVGDEIAHGTKLDLADFASSEEVQWAKDDYLSQIPEEHRDRLLAKPGLLEREAKAHMVRKFMEEKSFRDRLRDSNPKLWKRIVDAVLSLFKDNPLSNKTRQAVLDELRSRLQGKKPQENLSEDKKSSAAPQETEPTKPTDAKKAADDLASAGNELKAVMREIMSKMDDAPKPKRAKKPSSPSIPEGTYPDVKGEWNEGLMGPKPGSTKAQITKRLAERMFELAKDRRGVGHVTGTWFEYNGTGPEVSIRHYYTGIEVKASKEALLNAKSIEEVFGKKPKPKKSEITQAQADEALAHAKELVLKAFKATQGKPWSGIDPEVAANVANATKFYIKGGILSFKAFVERLIEDFGAEWLRDKTHYFESAWEVANELEWIDSPTGRIDASGPKLTTVTAELGDDDLWYATRHTPGEHPQSSLIGFKTEAEALAWNPKPISPDSPTMRTKPVYPDDSAYKAWMNRRHRIGDTPTSFLTGHSSSPVRDAAKTNPGLGLVITPSTKQYIGHAGDYSHVMVDNGAFSEFTGSAKFDPDKFFAMLDSIVETGVSAKVQFVVVPDKVGDWQGTNERWDEFYERARSYGMPLAYVGQDGIEQNMDTIPWDKFDVFFIGGSTPWKLGFDPAGEYKNFQRPTDEELKKAGMLPAMTELLREAKRRGKKIHMGRVNSWKRMEIANYGIQVDSVDGNYIGAAPNINLENVLGWLEKTGGEMFKASTYGTLEAPNRVELGKYFQQQLESGKDYKSIVEARKEAATLIAGEDANIEPGTPAAKAIDEAVEQGVVRAARSLAESSSDPLKVYDSLLDLYERQPRLNVRTGTSMRQQAYSTPAPAAWVATILSDTSRDNTAYDSSAGNGMLLLGVDPENAIANELNPDRAQALRELGYQVHEGDATEYTPEQQPDRIIINPPFGELEGKTWSIGGTTTDKIDHAIVLKTLESLPEDGKAVLIIGSKGFEQRKPKDELRRGEAYKNEKNFYNALYDGYNVTDHFTLHGDLYSKQGAAFPIDVIVIDGRGQSALPKPYQIDRQNAIPRVINSWQELRDVAERYLDTGSGRPSDLSTEPVEDDMDGLSSLLEGQGKGAGKGGRGPGKNTGGSDSVPPRGDAGNKQPRGDSGQPPVSGGSDEQGQSDSESVPDGGKPNGSGRRPSNTKRLDRPSPDVVEGDAETEFQVAYKKRSGTDGVGTLVPRTQARAVEEALEKAEIRYGNLDDFVAGELGYSRKELGKYFSAEQVDALALAMARHKEGKAFVLGDQTGVGKGRVAAGIMVYAKRQGLVPVFMTQSPDLYADMYRDLQDIGQHSQNEPFYALATNTLVGEKGTIQLPGGMELSQTADFAKNTLNAMADSVVSGGGPIVMITVEKTTDENGKPLGTTPTGKERVRKVQEQRDYDAVFTTYSQMQTVAGSLKDRHTALSRMAPNTFFVLDESHNAGGGSGSDQDSQNSGTTRADLIRGLLNESKGVLFLSATYAKRADVMDLYAKTGMGDSIEGREEGLIDTIQKGGLPLQQVLSEMLVEAGAYMRRERSFEGIDFDAKVEETGIEEAGQIANIFGAIDRLDRIKNEIIKSKAFRRWLISQGMGLGTDSATGRRGMESSTFSSIVHNLVNQMLLSIKADATANAAIESLKRGEAPVIALSNTMGSALDQFLETNPANIGDEIDFRFSRAAERYLERSREIMLTDVSPSGDRTSRRVRLPDDVLGEDGVAAYNEARMLIDEFAADIPASPIDWIRYRIEKAGYSVREVTGRDMAIDYSEGKVRLSQRPRDEIGSAGKLATVKMYNSGKLDAMILNLSGSTGLSAHASKLNPPAGQKRRHMIVAQADANIDTFMQMLGRINRTGQVAEKVVPTDPMSSRDDMMAELHQDQMGGEHYRKPRGTVTNLPHYTLLMTNVPAETRPAAVLIKKLSSLNANVTADSKGSVSFDAPDILNKVGDRVVAEYIADNPALNHALGDIVEVNAEGAPRVVPDIARKVSGRMAMRPIPEQQAFWDAVTETYAEEIDQLNKLGKNPLTATRMDLGAQTLERVEIFAGDPDADSPFLQPAYADRARVKKQGEPMTPEEIKNEINKFYGLEPGQTTGLVKAIRDWTQQQGELAENAISEKTEQQVSRLVNQEAIDRVRNRASNIESAIRRRLNSMAPGMSVTVSEVQEGGGYTGSISGVVIDVKAKSGREHLPTGWVATIALSSPDRVLRVPFSRIETSSSQAGDVYVAPAFEVAGDRVYAEWEEIGDVYEERIIGTGNVLAAFDKLVSQGDRGNIIFFTNEDGVSQRGVLMPRSFNLDRWAEKRPVIFANPQQVLDFISIAPGHQANDPNFAIQFTFDDGVMLVRSPRSRQRSGKYTTNQNLIEASGTDFVSVGQVLQMQVRGKKQQLAVIAAAQKLGPLIAANFYQDAKNVAGIGTDKPDGGTITPAMANPTRQSRSSNAMPGSAAARLPGEGIAAADIQKTVEEMFDVAVRQGGFSQRAAGIYKWMTRSSKSPPSPEVVRTKEEQYASLATLAHEVAHHIDETIKVVNGMPALVKTEVRTLDYEPVKARAFEGWAEFFRRYVTEPPIDVNGTMMPNTIVDAPLTTEWFEKTFLPAHPELAEKISKFREYAQQWANQSVFARIGSMISDRKPQDLRFKERWKQKGQRWINRLKTTFLDKFHTLEWIQQEARDKGYKGVGIYDLTMAYFMSASAHATVAFEEGVRSLTDRKQIGKTKLWDLSRHLKDDGEYPEAVRYALARHTLFMDNVKPGYNTGVDVADAQAFIDEVEALGKTDRYREFAKELAQFNDDLILMLVDAGALSSDDANKIINYYRDSNGEPHYFPLHRVQDIGKSEFAGTGAGFVNLGKPVRGRTKSGSGRQIIDPFDATVTRAIKFYGRAIQARQAHALAATLDPRMGGVGGMGGLMDRVPAKRIVHHGTIEEILDTLVDSGAIDADMAKAMRISARIRDPQNGLPSEKDLDWFANKHNIADWTKQWSDMEHAAETEPDALAVISLWRPDYTPSAQKRTVMIYDRYGNKLMYEMDDDLYQTATGMQEMQFGWFTNLMRESTKYFKTGAVGISTGFGTANFLRDFAEFQGKANHVRGLKSATKPWEMLGRYVAEKTKQSMVAKYAGKKLGLKQAANDPLIRLYEELGGKLYSVIGGDNNDRTVYRRKKLGKSTMSKLGLSIKRPKESVDSVLGMLQEMIAISDAPPRLADAEAALAELGFVVRNGSWFDTNTNQAVDSLPEIALVAASVAMSEATINFKRIGTAGAHIEAYLPFYNATVQATYRQYRQMKNLKSLGTSTPEGQRALRTLVYISALASYGVLYWLMRHDDDDWRNQDAWLRDGYWTWGAMVGPNDGKTYYRIPKPRDFGIVSNVVENLLDVWAHGDARKTSDILTREVAGRIPTGGGFSRAAVETYLANYDYFRGRELEDDSVKGLPKPYRTSSYTSRMSDYLGKAFGKTLNTSPIQFQHLLNSASGGIYGRLTETYDAAVDGRLGPEHIPFWRGLALNRHQTRPIGEFYQKKAELEEQAATQEVEKGEVAPEVASQRAYLGWISEVMTALRKEEGKLGKKRTFENEKYITGLARAALGYKEQESNPNPLTAKELPDNIREKIEEYRQLAVVGAAERLSPRSAYKSDEAYAKQAAKVANAEAKLRATNLTLDEAKQSLKDYWKKTYGSTHDMQRGRPMMKEALQHRLKKLDELFKGK